MGGFIFSYTVGVTLAVSFVILALFSLLKVINKKFTAKFQYWVWLILSLRLLIPVNILKGKPLVHIQTPYQWFPVKTMAQTNGMGIFPVQRLPQPVSTFDFLTAVWVTGMALYFIFVFVQYRRFERSLKRWGRPISREGVQQIFEREWKGAGIQKRLNVLFCPLVSTPMVVGFSSSTILLPREDYTPKQLQMIFSHELVHCRRNDVLYQLLLVVVCGIHWFNPLVHAMVRQARRNIEISCDSEVVKGQGLPFRQDYAAAILEVAKGGCRPKSVETAFGATFTVSGLLLKKRFLNLFDLTPKHGGVPVLVGLAAICVLCGSVFAFRGSDCNIQWLQTVTAGEIKEVIFEDNGRRGKMDRRQIQNMALWLNEMKLEGSPLVRNAEKHMERSQYQVTTKDGQVYQITCRGENYLNVNGKHYRRGQSPVFQNKAE